MFCSTHPYLSGPRRICENDKEVFLGISTCDNSAMNKLFWVMDVRMMLGTSCRCLRNHILAFMWLSFLAGTRLTTPSPIAAQGDAVNEDSIAVFCGSDVLYSPYLHHILSFQQSDLKFKVIDMIAVACNVWIVSQYIGKHRTYGVREDARHVQYLDWHFERCVSLFEAVPKHWTWSCGVNKL